MSAPARPSSAAAAGATSEPGNGRAPPSYFEEQREMLLNEISQSMEHVLQNLNKLNRSLEGVIAIGNEFSSVEALWSQFEGVMARDANEEAGLQAEKPSGDQSGGEGAKEDADGEAEAGTEA